MSFAIDLYYKKSSFRGGKYFFMWKIDIFSRTCYSYRLSYDKKIMIDCRTLPGRMKRKILCNVKSIILMNRSTN